MDETIREEEQPVAENSESDNEILNTISDEYLAKRRKNKIITFSSISLVAILLSLTIIILACIKIDIKPVFISRPTTYEVYVESGTPTFNLGQTDEDYEEFNNLVDSIFKTQLLTAIFTGRLGGYEINETNLNFYSSPSTKTGISSDLRTRLNTSYVRLKYDQPITLLNKDGSEYLSKTDSRFKLTFNELYFNIYNTNQEHEVTLLFATDGYLTGKITEIKVKVNTYSLYEYAEKY